MTLGRQRSREPPGDRARAVSATARSHGSAPEPRPPDTTEGAQAREILSTNRLTVGVSAVAAGQFRRWSLESRIDRARQRQLLRELEQKNAQAFDEATRHRVPALSLWLFFFSAATQLLAVDAIVLVHLAQQGAVSQLMVTAHLVSFSECGAAAWPLAHARIRKQTPLDQT